MKTHESIMRCDMTIAQLHAFFGRNAIVDITRTKTQLWLVKFLLLPVLALVGLGCQSGINLSPIQAASDESAILLTEMGKNHALLLEQQTRDKWLLCNTIADEKTKVSCRVDAVDRTFADNREVTIALQDAKNLQHVLAAIIETASICVMTSNEKQKCEQEAWQKALEVYPKMRALILRVQRSKGAKK